MRARAFVMDRARESSRATSSGSGRSNASGQPRDTLRARAAGGLELERALRVVYGGVMAELKPLGVVGMATFDPMAGFVSGWSSVRGERPGEDDRESCTRTRRSRRRCVRGKGIGRVGARGEVRGGGVRDRGVDGGGRRRSGTS